MFVCLFVCLFVSYKSISQKRKICISTFFRKKEISIFTIFHIEFYLAIYNLWLLLIMGFGPVGGRGGGQGGIPGGIKWGVGVSPSIRARAKVVRQHWQGKSIQICSFFRRIMGVEMSSGLTWWEESTSGLSHAPSKLWRHCAMQRYQRPFLFFLFLFLIFFFLQSTHSAYLRGITFRPQSGKKWTCLKNFFSEKEFLFSLLAIFDHIWFTRLLIWKLQYENFNIVPIQCFEIKLLLTLLLQPLHNMEQFHETQHPLFQIVTSAQL